MRTCDSWYWHFYLNTRSLANYYPFGMMEPGRQWAVDSSLFGYNDKEKTDEITGRGNSYDFGERMYDARVGRFWSLDPMKDKFPFMSPYLYAADDPIDFIDENGTQPNVQRYMRPLRVPVAQGPNGFENINPVSYRQQFGPADNGVQTTPIRINFIEPIDNDGFGNGYRTLAPNTKTGLPEVEPARKNILIS